MNKTPFAVGPLIVAALAAGGLAGAGVGLGWYPPVVGVGLAVLIGLGTGAVVLRRALRAKRARERGRTQALGSGLGVEGPARELVAETCRAPTDRLQHGVRPRRPSVHAPCI